MIHVSLHYIFISFYLVVTKHSVVDPEVNLGEFSWGPKGQVGNGVPSGWWGFGKFLKNDAKWYNLECKWSLFNSLKLSCIFSIITLHDQWRIQTLVPLPEGVEEHPRSNAAVSGALREYPVATRMVVWGPPRKFFETRVVRRQRSSPRENQIKIATFSECHSKFQSRS